MDKTPNIKLRSLLVLVLFIFGCASVPRQPTIIPQGEYDAISREISKKIKKSMKKYKVVGLSIALIANQELVWAEGFGYADLKNKIPATANTVYRIGSISKLFTVTAAMQLAEQGEIDIDKPFTQYVPEFSIKSRFEDTEPITPRTIMTHHSGIQGDILRGFFTRDAAHYSSVIEDLRNEYVAYPPNFIFSYSNIAMSLLGYMVEKVSGKDFVSYMDMSLFEPMEMNHSSFDLPTQMVEIHSKGYKKKKEYEDPDIREVPAGKMVSNVIDLSKFIRMILANGRYGQNQIIQPETVEKMLTVQNSNVALDLDIKWGLGWFLTPIGNLDFAGKVASHNGSTEVFHSSLIILPNQKLGVVVLTNSEMGRTIVSDIASSTLKLALKTMGIRPSRATEQPELLKNIQVDLSPYQGIYAPPFGYSKVELNRGRLKTTVDKFKIDLIPNNVGTFTPRLKIFRLFHKTLFEQQIQFREINGLDVIVLTQRGISRVFAQKKNNTILPDSWKNRVGEYDNIDIADNVIFVNHPQLAIEDDLLLLKGEILGDKINAILEPVNDNEAILFGLGRHMRETIQVITDEEGEELIKYSGYLFKKKNL